MQVNCILQTCTTTPHQINTVPNQDTRHSGFKIVIKALTQSRLNLTHSFALLNHEQRMLTSSRGAQHEAFLEPLIRTLKRLAMAAMRWLHMPMTPIS